MELVCGNGSSLERTASRNFKSMEQTANSVKRAIIRITNSVYRMIIKTAKQAAAPASIESNTLSHSER